MRFGGFHWSFTDAGTVPLAKAIAGLTGNAKSQLQQQVATAGFTTATFTEWIDNQHQPRKAVITEVGTSVTENITMTITSINQPVNITVPPASQTSPCQPTSANLADRRRQVAPGQD